MTDAPALSALGRAAKAYAALGWRVFPLYPRDKKPMSLCVGCLARMPAERGVKRIPCKVCGREADAKDLGLMAATADLAQIDKWWTKEPRANIGVRTGDGMIVVDVNVPDGADRVSDGEASLAELEAKHGALEPTPRQRTGLYGKRRGSQYVLAVAQPIPNSRSKIAPGVGVRGDGGYIVAAPSVHPGGARYEWDEDRRPSKTAKAVAPAWLIELATAAPKIAEVVANTPRPATDDIAHEWVRIAVDREYELAATAKPDTRSRALSMAAFALGQLLPREFITETLADATLQAAAEACGLAAAEGVDAVHRIIAAGLADGRMVPREGAIEKPMEERAPYQPPGPVQPEQPAPLQVVGGKTAAVRKPKPKPEEEGVEAPRIGWIIDDWHDYVVFKSNTRILEQKVLRNAVALLLYHRTFADMFVFNKRSQKLLITRKPPWTQNNYPYPRLMGDADIVGMTTALEAHGLRLPKGSVGDAIAFTAKEREYDPVMDSLKSFVWDKRPRIDHWLVDHLGADDSSFTRAAGAKWLIAAVARIMQPGCKFDHMLVLVGEQDLGKSRCLRLLAEALAPDVYTDRLSSLKEKDSMIELLGKVVVEMAEMVAIQGASVEQIKRFLSAQEDDLRMPWDRTTSRLPRSCVFAGTINPDGLGFLTDPTGSRRFWPVTVTKADFVAVAAEAAQMWAEALVRYEAGEHWWIEDAVLRQAAVDAAAEHTEFDVWAPRIDEIISTKTFVRCDQVLRDLGLDVNQMGRREQHRVAHHLRKAGWRQAVWRQGGINTRGWAAPRGARLVDEPIDDDPGPEDR